MIQPIMKDPIFLAQPAADATPADKQTAQDLLDTLVACKGACVGMAANMIGVCKRIIAFECGENDYMIMYNPEIVKMSSPTRQRRAVSPWRAPARPSAGNPSRCATRTRTFRSGSRPLLAGRRRSSSTRSTIAAAF